MNLEKSIEICKIISTFSADYGCHVALTGGCLYKEGNRKDLDILFYRIRQVQTIDYEGLFSRLVEIGFTIPKGFGWLFKSTYLGCQIDMFFPEEVGGEVYPRDMR